MKKLCAVLCILAFSLVVGDSALFAGEKNGKGKATGVKNESVVFEGRASWGDIAIAVEPSVLKYFHIEETSTIYRPNSDAFILSVIMRPKQHAEGKIKIRLFEVNSVTGTKKEHDIPEVLQYLMESRMNDDGTKIGQYAASAPWDIAVLEYIEH